MRPSWAFAHPADDTVLVRSAFSATPRLADRPERQRALWNCLRPYAWEAGVARQFVSAGEVRDLLDFPSHFELLGRPSPPSTEGILESLESERLISRDVGGKWNIHNLGALLLANDMGEFESRLARKAMRFVVYDGHGRAATVTHRKDFPLGYASGLARLNVHINTLIPSPEEGSATVRKARPLFPAVAIRELMANALIHQDMTISGAGPTVELFRNRIEITNPGAPLVEPERFIDFPPRSRNEALASLMRRMGLCEEQGTGIDKVVEAVEEAAPAPRVSGGGGYHASHLVRPATLRRHDDGGATARLLSACCAALLERATYEERHVARTLRRGQPECRPGLHGDPQSPR